MTNTEKFGCRELASALAAYGIRHIVTSPGSRNAPLLMALNRQIGEEVDEPQFRLWSVIDERSAAYSALGIARQSGEPVALVCTSGTALLNYAPAVAEAYYRHIPLAVVSADRPIRLSDRADSQTIRQPGALANFTVGSYSIVAEAESNADKWHINCVLNEALTAMVTAPGGPVHINVHLDAPLTREADYPQAYFRKVYTIRPDSDLSAAYFKELVSELRYQRILIAVADHKPDNRLTQALSKLSSLPNVAVWSDPSANVHAPQAWSCDALLAGAPAPDLVITCGGAPLSDRLKKWLRDLMPEHWHVGRSHTPMLDTFGSLERSYQVDDARFFHRLAVALQWQHTHQPIESDYRDKWARHRSAALAAIGRVTEATFSGPKAVIDIFNHTPADWNVELSNGMSVRFAALAPYYRKHSVACNRGTSGIDGSTSTAVGASAVYNKPTLLITGDMSAQYDIGALASPMVSPRLKIAVLANGRGGIFDVVATTRNLPELPSLIHSQVRLPLEQLAAGFGFRYLRAADRHQLRSAIREMVAEKQRPVILEVITDSKTDSHILSEIYEQAKHFNHGT